MGFCFVKINFNGVVNYVKIIKHGETWEYKDFILSASIYANISAYDIDYFTDLQGVRICEEDFVDIVTQQKTHPEFQLKTVLKNHNNKLLEIQAAPLTRQNCRLGYQMHINANDLEVFLLQTQNAYVLSKKIITGEPPKGLSDTERRAIIREGVDYLVSHFKTYHPDPAHITALALAIVELFPQLKTKQKENGGIDALYDRKKNRGYVISRLNRVRQKSYASELITGKTSRKRNTGGSSVSTETKLAFDIDSDENFLILKNLNVTTQKDLIKQKLLETLSVRIDIFHSSSEIGKFSKQFPFFFTSPDLILYDFEIRYPEKHQNFKNKWKICSPFIKQIFRETKGPHFKSLPEIEDLLPSKQDFFYLLNILPQVVAGKSSANIQRERFSIKKILVFRSLNLPTEELIASELAHPYIIAEGENKSATSQYHLCIERELIILPVNFTFIEAVDLLFKSHYVRGQHFDDSLKTFWTFIAYYFYEIEDAGTITSRIKEICCKLDQITGAS